MDTVIQFRHQHHPPCLDYSVFFLYPSAELTPPKPGNFWVASQGR